MKNKAKDADERPFYIREYFNSLNLDGWTLQGKVKSGGQAHVIEVINNNTKEVGVFRTLKRKNEKDIKRFHREVEIILKNTHPNIITILDYSKDKAHQWYISKKGIAFETYWQNFLDSTSDNYENVLTEAIRIIYNLSDGLASLHDEGVVHRDIKAKNIIMIDDSPVLIDFGIAFVTGEERLTPIDQAVANLYSPDPALNFMDDVPPWLDVFLLSQLLIWMVSKRTNKPHVQRPLDWRWVVYPNFNEDSLVKVKALTAVCSNYFTSPRNARELWQFIRFIFLNIPNNTKHDSMHNIEHLQEIIRVGKASSALKFSDSFSRIEVELPLFYSICNDFEVKMLSLLDRLKEEIPISVDKLGSVEKFMELFQVDSKNGLLERYECPFIQFTLGDGNVYSECKCFYVLYTSLGVERNPWAKPIENRPAISVTLNIINIQSEIIPKSFFISNNSGMIELLNLDLQPQGTTNIDDFLAMIRTIITEEDLWKVLYSQI